ncbi:MAG: glycosyltransferase [Prevotellaceae bacterium]|jgi:glycosyltransferase involved in cell wall biosynthesis|nr:glycosyltransferase [Prevotellaceae bacterium]
MINFSITLNLPAPNLANTAKTVSIVMCTYNGAPYLRQQLDTVVNQTCPLLEIIIQDDCSTDNTMEILQEYAAKYPAIRIYQNEERKGHILNFFSATSRAVGEYIAFADQDDIWKLDKIEKMLECIGNNWMAVCFSIPFHNESEIKEEPDLSKLQPPNLALERQLYVPGAAAGHAMLIHRILLEKIPQKFLTSKERGHDVLLHIVAAAYDKVVFCKNTATFFRRHPCAFSYIPAENTEKSLSNAIAYIRRTLRLYKESRPFVEDRLISVIHILSSLPDEAYAKYDALKLGKAHLNRNWIKTFYYCIKFRNRLFYRRETNPVLSFMRGLYFPISCSDYSRAKCKSYQKNSNKNQIP